jgi:tetratricopeptide (TPR) repeat protein
MKKIILMGIFAITVVFATAQTSNRTSAFNYLKKGKLDKAVEYIEPTTTHEKTMNEAKTWFFRGNIYLAIANSDNPEYKKLAEKPLEIAIDSYKKAMSLPDANEYKLEIIQQIDFIANTTYNEGIEAYKVNNFKGAAEAFLRTSDLKEMFFGADTNALVNAAVAANQANEPKMARQIYEKLMKENGPSPSIYGAYPATLLQCGDTTAAIAAAAKGRQLYPDNFQVLIAETNVFLSTKQPEKAMANLQSAVQKDPNNVTIVFAIGAQYDQMGNVEEAEKAYLKVLSLDPNHFDAVYNLGALFVNKAASLMADANKLPLDKVKEFDVFKTQADSYLEKALPYLEKAHVMAPTDKSTILTLKEIYARKSMFDKVKEMDALLNK